MPGPVTVVIVNPKSQGGAVERKFADIHAAISAELPVEIVTTRGPGDATVLAREAIRGGADVVCALGGDGTINEVVNGFFDERGARLPGSADFAIIPYGTGGDFRRTMQLPTDVREAARVIAGGKRRPIDVGKMTYMTPDGTRAERYFANIASFGVSGVVDQLINKSKKRFGKLSFFMASARATMRYHNQRVELRFDDDSTQRVEATINTVAVANGRYFGGSMQVAPEAEVDDGQFDVVMLGDLTFGDSLRVGRRIYGGNHLALDKVSQRRARIVDARAIERDEIVELDLDGENVGRLPARFELLPGAVTLRVPG